MQSTDDNNRKGFSFTQLAVSLLRKSLTPVIKTDNAAEVAEERGEGGAKRLGTNYTTGKEDKAQCRARLVSLKYCRFRGLVFPLWLFHTALITSTAGFTQRPVGKKIAKSAHTH